VEALLAQIQRPEPSPGDLRVLRAIEVLELAGGEAARRTLEDLAQGAEGEPRTREARTALQRLRKRPTGG
jgi:hypothetical protein